MTTLGILSQAAALVTFILRLPLVLLFFFFRCLIGLFLVMFVCALLYVLWERANFKSRSRPVRYSEVLPEPVSRDVMHGKLQTVRACLNVGNQIPPMASASQLKKDSARIKALVDMKMDRMKAVRDRPCDSVWDDGRRWEGEERVVASSLGFCWLDLFDERDHRHVAWGRDGVQKFRDVLEMGARLYRDERFDQFVEDAIALAAAHEPNTIRDNLGVHSAFDQAIDRYTSPANIQALESYTFPFVAEAMKRMKDIAPWRFSGASKAKATELGIPVSDFFCETHSHPLHAALRRMDVCEVLPQYVRTPAVCVSFSAANYGMLSDRVAQPMRCLNPVMDLKDMGRYSNETVSPDVFSIPKFEEPTMVCLDSGHYQTPENMIALFEMNPTLRTVILTHVYPLAALESHRSPEPQIATWAKQGSDMIYVPEGDTGGAYRQPWNNPLLLAHRLSASDNNLELSCGVVWSKLNSHVQIITRYPLASIECIAMRADAYMPMPKIFDRMPPCGLIPVKYYTRLVDYGRAVQVRDRDLYGKIRQQVNNGEYSLNIVEKDVLVLCVMAVLEGFSLDMLPTTLHSTLGGYLNHRFLAGPVRRFFYRKIWGKLVDRNCAIVAEPNELRIVPTCKLRVRSRAGALVCYDMHFTEESAESLFDLQGWDKMTELVAEQGFGRFVLPPANKKWRAAFGRNRFRDLTVADYRRVMLEDQLAEAAQLALLDPDKTKALLARIRADVAASNEARIRRAQIASVKLANIVGRTVHKVEGYTMSGLDMTSDAVVSLVATSLERMRKMRTCMDRYCKCCRREPEDVPLPGNYALGGVDSDLLSSGSSSSSDADTLSLAFAPSSDTASLMTSADSFVTADAGQPVDEPEVVFAPGGGFIMPGRGEPSQVPARTVTFAEPVDVAPPTVQQAVVAARAAGITDSLLDDVQHQWGRVITTGMLKPKLWPQGVSVARQWNEIFPKSCDRRVHESPYRIMSAPRGLKYPRDDCILEAIEKLTSTKKVSLMATIAHAWPLNEPWNVVGGLPEKVLEAVGCRYELLIVVNERGKATRRYGLKDGIVLILERQGNHIVPKYVTGKGIIIRPHYKVHGIRNAIVEALSELPAVRWQQWIPGTARAEKYVREMIRGATGTIHRWAINEQALAGWEEGLANLSRRDPVTRWLAVIEGDPGCRKSSAIQKVLKKPKFKKDHNFQVAIQTAVLCQDWKDKLQVQEKDPMTGKGLADNYCTTYEKALAKGFPCKVFVTDEDKLPPGFMELKAHLSPSTSHFIRLGDRFQARWHDPNADCLLNDDMSEGMFFSEWAEFYIQGTWRFGPSWANFFRMPTFAKNDTRVFITDIVPTCGSQLQIFLNDKSLDFCNALHEIALILYPSDAQVRAATALSAADVVSHSGSQGRGEDLVYVIMDETALKAEDLRTIYAALTRVKKFMIIGLTYNRSAENLAREQSHPVFSRLRTLYGNHRRGQPITVRPTDSIDIKTEMGGFSRPVRQVLAGPHHLVRNQEFLNEVGYEWPDECLDPDGTAVVGREYYRQPDRNDPGYQDNAQVRVYLDQPRERRLTDYGPIEVPLPGTKVATHLPIASRRQWVESQVSQCGDRFDMELIYKGEFSDQFPDRWMFRHDAQDIRAKLVKAIPLRKDKRALAGKLKVLSGDNPLAYKPNMSLCGQDQKTTDHVAFMRGVKERLKRSTFRHNELIYANGTSVYGVALFNAVKKAFRLKDNYAWDSLRFESYVAEFAEKRSMRSAALKTMSLPRSEPEFRQFITAKRQMKVKPEIPTAGKPLQTLMIHCDYYLYALGPINAYMTDFFLEHAPENIYLHVKKTFADFDAFAVKLMREATDPWEGDGKHFETSLDHNATYMFEQLMRLMSVPEFYIQVFLDYKMHAVSQLMIHFFMTMSGEAFTWLINTIKNIAETHCRYSVPATAPQIYGGDDETHAHRYPVNPGWHVWRSFETCELKQEYTWTPRAFSYYLTKHGAVKDPVHLFRKLLIAEERGKLEDVLAGYALEARSLFIKGDLVVEILPQEAVDAWQLLNSELFNIMKRSRIDLTTVESMKLHFVRPLIPSSVKHWALGFIADINTEYTCGSPNSPLSREFLETLPVLADHIQNNDDIDQVL